MISVALKTPLEIRLGICIRKTSLLHRSDDYIGFIPSQVFWGVLRTRFGTLEFKIGSLESEKIIIGFLASEKIGSLQDHTGYLTFSLKKTCTKLSPHILQQNYAHADNYMEQFLFRRTLSKNTPRMVMFKKVDSFSNISFRELTACLFVPMVLPP